jgi:hypothetical protein
LGLLATRRVDVLRSRWAWLGVLVAVVLFAPHLVWQEIYGWPTREFIANATAHKNRALSAGEFAVALVFLAGPTAAVMAALGGAYLLCSRETVAVRALGVAWVALLAFLAFQNSKPYYAGASFALTFAAGAVAVERWLVPSRGPAWWRGLAVASLVVSGVVAAPLAKPLLPIDSYVAYARALGVAPSTDERKEVGRLPQLFADAQGWPELVDAVARVYGTLPPEDRRHACILGTNYGHAGAVDLLGPAQGCRRRSRRTTPTTCGARGGAAAKSCWSSTRSARPSRACS